jgi:hypothetical protein
MTRQQRIAIYNVIVIIITFAAFAGSVPKFGLVRAQASLGLLGFLAAVGLFYRHPKNRQVQDERECLLYARSLQIAGAVCCIAFVGAILAMYFYLSNIAIDLMPALIMGGIAIFILSQSVALLCLYHWPPRS